MFVFAVLQTHLRLSDDQDRHDKQVSIFNKRADQHFMSRIEFRCMPASLSRCIIILLKNHFSEEVANILFLHLEQKCIQRHLKLNG